MSLHHENIKAVASPEERIEAALAHAAHLLPQQNPLDRFIHHNPLHAFEEQPFEEAVVEAAELFGTRPFLPEGQYRASFAAGRIFPRDLEVVIREQIDDGPVASVTDRRRLAMALLLHPIEPLSGSLLAWTLSETDALREPRADLDPEARAGLLSETSGDAARALGLLWERCLDARPSLPVEAVALPKEIRVRDVLKARWGIDPDQEVNTEMIRWCAAYLDQGIAYWPMLDRDEGFFMAWLKHAANAPMLGRSWQHLARSIARGALAEKLTAEQLAARCLERLGHPEETWEEVIFRTLHALRGFSGMFQRLAERPDLAPERRLPTRLACVLAVRLALDLSAAASALSATDGLLDRAKTRRAPAPSAPPDPAWQLFQLAQILGLGPHALSQLSVLQRSVLLGEAQVLSSVERRKLWHLAYERRHRVEVLDSLEAHMRRRADVARPAVRARVVFCIDDREESIRRHLEEVAPWVETYGFAGNFGIAMYYQGAEHGHPVALGPAHFEPKHIVRETGFSRERRTFGLVRHGVDISSQTLLRGALVAITGVTSSVPLTLRLLAPGLHAKLTAVEHPKDTEVSVVKKDEAPDHGLIQGFSLEERANIVRGTLEIIGLVEDFSDIVLVLGHGSRSMNNPHEAAHDCGACGGGRGGPNARVYARMANDPEVRAILRTKGIDIPDTTWFVGGYHNTCDDAVDLYDLHHLPEHVLPLFEELKAALDEARTLDAHERCRRFDNAPLDLSPPEALRFVESRAEDLSQPRPEYGHATNAVAFIGRRDFSRGLFLDRRAFLVSYDAGIDPDGSILARLLSVVVPVGAGINLEYWFSVVDPTGWGCGTKLPHNICGMLGVMDGHASDLRTGLPWQMVEIHEPVRLLCVVEATPARLLEIAGKNPVIARHVVNGWVQLVSLDPETKRMHHFKDGAFVPWEPESDKLPVVPRSIDWYRGSRGFLPPAAIEAGGER